MVDRERVILPLPSGMCGWFADQSDAQECERSATLLLSERNDAGILSGKDFISVPA